MFYNFYAGSSEPTPWRSAIRPKQHQNELSLSHPWDWMGYFYEFNEWLAGVTQNGSRPLPTFSTEKGPVRVSNDWLWTCRGECFGYRAAMYSTYDGRQAGRFTEGDEVYRTCRPYMEKYAEQPAGY